MSDIKITNIYTNINKNWKIYSIVMKMERVKQTNIYFILFWGQNIFFTRFILLFFTFKGKLSRSALFNLSSEQNT